MKKYLIQFVVVFICLIFVVSVKSEWRDKPAGSLKCDIAAIPFTFDPNRVPQGVTGWFRRGEGTFFSVEIPWWSADPNAVPVIVCDELPPGIELKSSPWRLEGSFEIAGTFYTNFTATIGSNTMEATYIFNVVEKPVFVPVCGG